MNPIVKGILDGAKEGAREIFQPTVSLVRGGLTAYRTVAAATWGASRVPQCEQITLVA